MMNILMVRPLNNPHKIMSIENPKENLADNRGKEKVENFETRASFEGFSDEEKKRIFENAKKVGAWRPIQEGLRIGISKSKLILYAEEVLAEKANTGDAEGVANFKGALERHGFVTSKDERGKFLVNISSANEKQPESPEEQFEKAKSTGALAAIEQGFQLRISGEKIEEFAKTTIAENINMGRYLEAINILARADMGGLNMGSSEEIEATTTGLYGKCLQEKKYHAAIEIARMKWGKQSEQYKGALKAYEEDPENKALREAEEKREKELEKWSAKISKDATIADLLEAVEESDENLGQSDIFYGELHDNFNPEVADELLELDLAGRQNIKVVDFFKKHGYSKKDIEIFLPVKFKRERRKN